MNFFSKENCGFMSQFITYSFEYMLDFDRLSVTIFSSQSSPNSEGRSISKDMKDGLKAKAGNQCLSGKGSISECLHNVTWFATGCCTSPFTK